MARRAGRLARSRERGDVGAVQVGEGVARDLREQLFIKILGFSFGNLDRQKTGQLMVRLTSDVASSE